MVILNASAGNADHSPALTSDSLAAAFDKQNIAAEIEFAEPGRLVESAERALQRATGKEIDAIIVGGGDGTIRSLAAILAGSNIPLGILPLGTLNHFAKDLGIPIDLESAIGVVAERQVQRVDLGDVNGRTFVNNSSIGIYPFMVLDRDRRRQLHGMAKWTAMALALWRVLRRFPLRRITLIVQGTAEVHRTPCLFVGNNQYGISALSLGKRDRLDAGALWLHVAKPRSRGGFLWMVGRMALGFVDIGRDLTTLKADAVEIQAAASRLPVALDGEVEIIETPLRYEIRPRALTVFAPMA